ncbi:hypothetical protein [Streptomyces agglomeratus]|nr:hypothetical protein [Streptomyces agglomeratus]
MNGLKSVCVRLDCYRAECFYFDPCELDEDDWTEGFVRVPPGE